MNSISTTGGGGLQGLAPEEQDIKNPPTQPGWRQERKGGIGTGEKDGRTAGIVPFVAPEQREMTRRQRPNLDAFWLSVCLTKGWRCWMAARVGDLPFRGFFPYPLYVTSGYPFSFFWSPHSIFLSTGISPVHKPTKESGGRERGEERDGEKERLWKSISRSCEVYPWKSGGKRTWRVATTDTNRG